MSSWEAASQPVGKSRWRLPTAPEWPDSDLVAVGADLELSTVIDAYRRGMFPMGVSELGDRMGWWSPNPRGILPLDSLRVTRSMRQSAKRFDIRVDTCFGRVIRACADPSRGGSWITDEFIDGYTRLHELGWAHSIEVFNRQGGLAGGLYGVRINGCFSGESMFHIDRDASKVALMALVDLMRSSGMTLLDVQWCSEHLASLGAIAIPRPAYLARLAAALRRPSSGRLQGKTSVASARRA
ncbi:MAG TPA: leucyl/phenylalanyl-tRNA--protein transferase [Vicinamibacterales bacterium]|nr:leucyl/phenylalanyl-tRNA--protein transferase [Vicinamibacterales bacterium]